jgi:hypothetical protein
MDAIHQSHVIIMRKIDVNEEEIREEYDRKERAL